MEQQALIKVNTSERVVIYIASLEQIKGRRRVQIPFDPIVDSGKIKYINFYPPESFPKPVRTTIFPSSANWYDAMYPQYFPENGNLYPVVPTLFPFYIAQNCMITLAKKGGDYLFRVMPITYFIPNYGGNYRIQCDFDVDFDRSFIRFFSVANLPAIPFVIPLYFEMWEQDGDDINYRK